MTAPQFWDKSWEDLLDGTGTHLKWKAGEKNENYRIAHEFLLGHGVLGAPGTVFIPLAGDGIFAPYIYRQGHTVVAVELIEKAVASLRKRFNEDISGAPKSTDVHFTATETDTDVIQWTSEDGRIRIWNSDLFKVHEEEGSFDLLFDKDAFGALPFDIRKKYVEHVARLVKPGGHVFLECRNKSTDPDTSAVENGPPFHVSDEAVRDIWLAAGFELVYKVPSFCPAPMWIDQAFLLRKKTN